MNIFTAACVVVFLQFFIDVLIKLLAFLRPLAPSPHSLQLQWRADAHVERLSLSLSLACLCKLFLHQKCVDFYMQKPTQSALPPPLPLLFPLYLLLLFPPFVFVVFIIFGTT